MKYIMLQNQTDQRLIPVLFDEELTHKDVAKGLANRNIKLVSAGFWLLNQAGGESESLKMGPRDGDTEAILLFLKGFSSLDVKNLKALEGLNRLRRHPIE